MSSLSITFLVMIVLLAAGCILIFRLDELWMEMQQQKKLRKAKVRALLTKENTIKKNLSKLSKTRDNILAESNVSRSHYLLLSIACAVAGVFLGQAVYASFVVSVTLSIAGLYVPMMFFGYRQAKVKALNVERLESSMMVISNSYIITEDLVQTIQDNLKNLEYQEPFNQFLTYIKFIDNDLISCMRRVEMNINNLYFSQWIDALCLSQSDRAMKYVAVSVVESMHDMLQVHKESEAAMFSVWQDYFIALAMVTSLPLIFRFIMPDAYMALSSSLIGQTLFVLLIAAVVYSIVKALKINTPLSL
ncbi:MAG: hypothetical protein IKC03_11465 [Oscillospiraceae bacterium]|nr:hypothetical protein [Oscillospiraceae bacterium]